MTPFVCVPSLLRRTFLCAAGVSLMTSFAARLQFGSQLLASGEVNPTNRF